MSSETKELSEVEGIKEASDFLRGTIQQSLTDGNDGFSEDDKQLLKFHGLYQQKHRDKTEGGAEKKNSFMLRGRIPGGRLTAEQYLAWDYLGDRFGGGSLRLTTRQSVQLHGLLKEDLKSVMQEIHRVGLTSVGACGDVVRNVTEALNITGNPLYNQLSYFSGMLSDYFKYESTSYIEIWLDDVQQNPVKQERIYGKTYLPRKFKIALAVPPVNDVDVFAHDLGFIAIIGDGAAGPRLAGFNVAVGGGLGATHGDPATYPRLAQVIGCIAPDDALAVTEAVVTTQRDFGDRANRKHARLKYTIETMGLAAFVAEVERRAGVRLAPAQPYAFTTSGDRFGWTRGFDGRWHLNLRIPAGRIADRDSTRHLSGLRAIALVHRGDFRLTPNQNLIIANVATGDRASIDALVLEHGLDLHTRASPTGLDALACVALPTCPLAMAEAERYLPDFLAAFEARLAHHGLARVPVHVRISGCPNGCSRPSLAEVALVGKAPGRYNLHLGGNASGERLNVLHRENLTEAAILEALDPLLSQFANEREPDERFGDFLWRAKLLSA